jgi:hypothetical protein
MSRPSPPLPARQRGLEDLRWPSLTRPEKLAVAAVLVRYTGGPAHAHLDNVAFELLECTSGHVPLVLTPLQNRTIAQAMESFAAGLESAAERFPAAPEVARTAHYSAGYLRSLLDRLVKGAAADAGEGMDRVVQLLALDAASPAGPGALVSRALERLRLLGALEVLEPVLPGYADEAARRCREALPKADDGGFDIEIVDVRAARSRLARRVFAAALSGLGQDGAGWLSFLASLREGRVQGCEDAREYPEVTRAATRVAYTLAKSIRAHLAELAGLPWDAVSPGLKAILDRYPALKREASLREFVTAEIRRARRQARTV